MHVASCAYWRSHVASERCRTTVSALNCGPGWPSTHRRRSRSRRHPTTPRSCASGSARCTRAGGSASTGPSSTAGAARRRRRSRSTTRSWRAPVRRRLLGRAGVTLVGPTLMAHGTERAARPLDAADPRRRRRVVPVVQRARTPAAISPRLSTRAEQERRRVPRDRPEGLVVVRDASPTWASRWCAPIPTRPPHKGISMLAIPMDAPGVDVRPLRQITGEHEFNEVFFDDVEVPVEQSHRPRERGLARREHDARQRARARRSSGRSRCCTKLAIDALVAGVRARGRARRPARAPAARAVVDRRRDLPPAQRAHARPARARRGDRRGVEPREVVLGRRSSQRLVRDRGRGARPGVAARSRRTVGARACSSTRANSIMGGTSEIQRNIIGERAARTAAGAEDDVRHRPARSRRSGALRARAGIPHDVWTRLRAEAPVARVEAPGYEPFWAVTKHADIMQIASQPRAVLERARDHARARRARRRCRRPEILVMLDPPRHGPMRRVVSARFTPNAVRARQRRRRAHRAPTSSTTRRPRGDGGECDFVERIAAPFPLAVIAWILGVPERRLGTAVPLDQRDHRQGRSRVPPAGRVARPDDEAGARRAARVLRSTSIEARRPNRRTIS